MKTMLITGASRGIGAATALLAAENGYAVAINYHRNREAAQNLADRINATGGYARIFQADVSREEEIIRLFDEVEKQMAPLSSLVNNAGTLELQSRLEDITWDRLQRVFALNTFGLIICCREAIKRMAISKGGNGGTIVNVSSIAARTGSPFEYTDYAASKGAVDTLTLGLSKELAEEGIRVNAVRPGFIDTDIHALGGEPGRLERIKDSIPLRRGGNAQEVAEAIVWLASDRASFSTGILLDVTGGR